MSSIHVSLFAVALLAAGGCKKETVGVDVQCSTPTSQAVVCEVKQTLGTAEAEACWDVTITCGNGEVVKAPRSCQKVKDGASETVTIPRSELENADQCEGGPPTMEVSHLTINGKDAKPK